MKKSHGPDFRAARIELAKCSACHGRAVVRGVFHELPCEQCNACGWVSADTGKALPLDVLVTQLSLRLRAAEQQIKQVERPEHVSGPDVHYTQNNRRGAGGTNYTGD